MAIGLWLFEGWIALPLDILLSSGQVLAKHHYAIQRIAIYPVIQLSNKQPGPAGFVSKQC